MIYYTNNNSIDSNLHFNGIKNNNIIIEDSNFTPIAGMLFFNKIRASCNLNNIRINIVGKHNNILIQPNLILKKNGILNITIYGNNNTLVLAQSIIIEKILTITFGNMEYQSNNSIVKIGTENYFNGNTKIEVLNNNSVFKFGRCNLFADRININNNNTKVNSNCYDISLNDHIWICRDVTLNSGALISSNSVIAQRSSVCSKILESNVIVAGRPAKIVKNNINWCHHLLDYHSFSLESIQKIISNNEEICRINNFV